MKRNYTLDFIRFLAIFIVLVSHFHFDNPSVFFKLLTAPGYLGVELFFALSGYLVSGLIITEYDKYGSFKPTLFLIRRGLKIYPLYYFVLIVASVYQLLTHRFSIYGFLCDFFFLSNYTSYSGRAWFWTLSLEEHFYLILCFIFVILIKLKTVQFGSIKNIFIFSLCLSISYRLYVYFNYNEDFRRDSTMTHGRLDAFFWGVLLYYASYYKNNFYKNILKYHIFIVSICLVIISLNYTHLNESRVARMIFSSLNPFCFGFIIVILITKRKFNDNFLVQKLSFIGKYSYSIYLIHGFVGVIFFKLHSIIQNQFMFFIVYNCIIIIAAILVSITVEIPFLKLRDKYFPSRSKRLA